MKKKNSTSQTLSTTLADLCLFLMVLRKQFSEANLKIVNIQKQAVGALCDHEQATCENTVGSIKRDTYTETK